MAFDEGVLYVRNRNHILNKAYRGGGAAKQQYAPTWGWGYNHRDQFEELYSNLGGPVAVYGEWLYAVHTVTYDRLPDVFIPFAIYDPHVQTFLDPLYAIASLDAVGFTTAPIVHEGPISTADLERLTSQPSTFSSQPREGVVVSTGDKLKRTGVVKMVVNGFVPGQLFDLTTLLRQPRPRRS